MLQRMVIAGTVLLVLAVFVCGWEKTASYVAGIRGWANDEADDRVPLRLERARIGALIRQEHEKVLGFGDRIAGLEAQRDGMARHIEGAQRKLSEEKELLKRIKTMLDEGRDEYTIGRQTYSYAEVNADALQRLRATEEMQEAIDEDSSQLRTLDTAIQQADSRQGEARRRLGELRGALARLDQRNVNADARLQIAALVDSIAATALPVDSELERAVRNYERRIGAKERRADARLGDSGPFRIDYSAEIVMEDASDAIGRLFNPAAAPEPVAAARLPRLPAAEVLEGVKE